MSDLSISEVAKLQRLSRQAVYLGIMSKKLKAYRKGHRYYTTLENVLLWRKMRYSRAEMEFKGEKVFVDGYTDVKTASKLIKVPPQKLYYAIYNGKNRLPYEKIGSVFRLKVSDVLAYGKWLKDEHTRKMKRFM